MADSEDHQDRILAEVCVAVDVDRGPGSPLLDSTAGHEDLAARELAMAVHSWAGLVRKVAVAVQEAPETALAEHHQAQLVVVFAVGRGIHLVGLWEVRLAVVEDTIGFVVAHVEVAVQGLR